jgi:hypothetical protein
VELILSNVFLVQLIGALAEVAGNILDCMQIAFNCTLRVIAALELFQHPFS